jgi:hypothetical protein
MLTRRAGSDLVGVVDGLHGSKSCTAVAAGLVRSRGLVSEAAHARLLCVEVRANTAVTLDTTGIPTGQGAHWVRTGKATWKVSEPEGVFPF